MLYLVGIKFHHKTLPNNKLRNSEVAVFGSYLLEHPEWKSNVTLHTLGAIFYEIMDIKHSLVVGDQAVIYVD